MNKLSLENGLFGRVVVSRNRFCGGLTTLLVVFIPFHSVDDDRGWVIESVSLKRAYDVIE